MAVLAKLSGLTGLLSKESDILMDPTDGSFIELSKRWTDIGRLTPAAIIVPASEEDIQKTVQWAVKEGVPFVPKSGGHSEWSTIGKEGAVIDLAKYKSIEIDTEARTVSIRGSMLQKEVATALAERSLCTALGNGNTVGSIGYFLNGGVPICLSNTGFGADNIVSARVVTASGELLEVTESTHPDLLWALRGAGQYFGLVTQLKIRAYPVSVLGSDDGTIWTGSFIFPDNRARAVARIMRSIVNDTAYPTSGLMMIVANRPLERPTIVIAARFAGSSEEAEKVYRLLYNIRPTKATSARTPVQDMSDSRADIAAKGTFKRFDVCGLWDFNVASFLETIEIFKEMISECPDAISSAFNFQWDSRHAPPASVETSMTLHDVRMWQNNLIWHTDMANRAKVDEYSERCKEVMRSGSENKQRVDYANGTRAGPIEYRYRGEQTLKRLKELKIKWDPNGVFTRELL